MYCKNNIDIWYLVYVNKKYTKIYAEDFQLFIVCLSK